MKNKTTLKVLFVCNRGGHFSQMMALKELFPLYNSLLVTDLSNIAKSYDFNIPVKFIKSFREQRLSWIYLFINFIQCFIIYIKFHPKVIISTGSNLTVFMFILGKLFGSKLIYIETRAKVFSKTSTGKIIGPLCDKIVVQWPEMLTVYNKSVYWGQLV